MAEIIKGSSPINTIVVDGDVKISNEIRRKNGIQQEAGENGERIDADVAEFGDETEEDPDKNIITITQQELDAIRAQYRMDGQQYEAETRLKCNMELAGAREEAEKILTEAKGEAEKLLSEIGEKTEKAIEESKVQGYNMGYRDGEQKGEENGYVQGLKKCKETLLDLKKLCEDIERERNELMAENRRAIFDLSMEIAQKITMTMLSQKDKSALQRMITAAAKQFRNAKTIKVTLSKLDLSEDVDADLKLFEKCFSSTAQVEFEVLEGAEKGTLMLETESEILDAGVSTQLKMIEELGSGKYRDKEVERESIAPITEEPQETVKEAVKETPKKSSRKAAKEAAEEPVKEVKEQPAEETAGSSRQEAAEAVEAAEAEDIEALAEAVAAEVGEIGED